MQRLHSRYIVVYIIYFLISLKIFFLSALLTYLSVTQVWDQNIMSTYVYLLSGRSSYTVGMLTGVSGLVQAFMAPLMGWAADRLSRGTVLRSAGMLGKLIISVIYYYLELSL